jgi:hypothetical protein
LPEPDDNEYKIPLHELTGKHGYALARNEDDDTPPEPGAPVAYVADPVGERPNTMTIEGAIVGIGNMAAAAARKEDDTTPAWVLRLVLAAFVVPIVLVVIGRLTEWFPFL